jgi:hypothetical protein
MSLRFSHDTHPAPRERFYVRVDRLRSRMRRCYLIQRPATYRDRPIRWGFVARWGRLRLRCYLLGRREAAEARRLQAQLDLSIWFETLLIATVGGVAIARVVAA